MKTKMKGLVVATTLLLLGGWGLAQTSQQSSMKNMHQGQHSMMQGSQTMQQCQMMKGRRQEMMSKMKNTDRELEALVQKLQSANDQDQKLQLMETLLARMVETRAQMNKGMMEMMPQMMQHMSGHMQMAQESGDASMMNCPMMGTESQASKDSVTKDQPHQH